MFNKWRESFLLSKLKIFISSHLCLSASLAGLTWSLTYFIQGWLSHITLIHMLICSMDNPYGSQRELEIFLHAALSVCLLLSQQPNPLWKPSFIVPPTHRILLTCPVFFFFPCSGKGVSGINNPLKCHQIPWSPGELCPRARGTGVLTLDIKQHFISYYGMTTTLYNSSSPEMPFSTGGLWSISHWYYIL